MLPMRQLPGLLVPILAILGGSLPAQEGNDSNHNRLNVESIESAVAPRTWQIDFQAEAGGAYSSKDPVTSKFDAGFGSSWNGYTIKSFNGDFDTAVVPDKLASLCDSLGNSTDVSFVLLDRVLGYNCPGLGTEPESLESATADHFFFAQGSDDRGTANPVRFAFAGLPPGKYDLTVYCNPTVHNPPRGFRVCINDSDVVIHPEFNDNPDLADAETIVGKLAGILVEANGELNGEFASIPGAGDPSVAALRLIARPPHGDTRQDVDVPDENSGDSK